MKTIFPNTSTIERKWHVIDAAGKTLGRIATQVVMLLRGKRKPTFTPNQETGDYVIIVNAEKVRVTGGKGEKKIYYRHSGYPSGLTGQTFNEMLAKKPTFPLEAAIKGMLPKGRLGNKLFQNVKIYAGENHPHEAQQPEPYEV